jgi:hypothetical protein
MPGARWYVFHDGGYSEASFEMDLVTAPSAMEAAKKVHKKHNHHSEREYHIVPAEEVMSIKAHIPDKPMFVICTKDLK